MCGIFITFSTHDPPTPEPILHESVFSIRKALSPGYHHSPSGVPPAPPVARTLLLNVRGSVSNFPQTPMNPLLPLLLVFSSATSAPAPEPAPAAAPLKEPLKIVVTIPPLVGIVKSIAPEGSTITGLMAPGQSEHGYEFRPSDLNNLAQADVAVLVGLGLEPAVQSFLTKQSSPNRQVVNLGLALNLEKPGEPAKPHTHDHDHDDHDHDEHALDVHIWLDPILVNQSLPQIADALKKSAAQHGDTGPIASAIDARLAATQARIKDLDEHIRAQLAPFKGQAIVTHHAAFARFAARYGLTIAQVIRPFESAEPTPAQMMQVLDAIKAQHVRVIFVEPQFNAKIAQHIADSAHVRLGTLDPLGDGDWFALMQHNADALAKGLAIDAPGAPAQ